MWKVTERFSLVENNGKTHEAMAGEHVVEIECLASTVRVAGYFLADGTAIRRIDPKSFEVSGLGKSLSALAPCEHLRKEYLSSIEDITSTS